MIVKATAAVAALAATLTIAPTASATLLPTGPLAGGGGFVIQSCGESGSTQGWAASNNATARVETFTDCPPALGRYPEYADRRYYTGLHAGGRRGRDSVTLDDAQAGDQAELTFTATGGTQITRLRMWRSLLKNDDNDWSAYIQAGSTTVDSCEIVWPQTFCGGRAEGSWAPNAENDTDPGQASYYDSALPANLPSLSASTFTVGILCRAQGNSICGNGFLAPDAHAEIYSAFLTLSDASDPTLGAAGGDWEGTTTITDTPAFTVGGSDNTGIRAARLYLDGQQVAEQTTTCTYDRPRPCTDLTASGPLGFNPATVADGAHDLQLAVEDAAGNETVTAPVTRLVDGTPPPAPQLTAVNDPPTRVPRSINATSIKWAVPPEGTGPISATQVAARLCPPTGACNPPRTISLVGEYIVQTGGPGYTVRVRLIDTAGREGPDAVYALPYTAPAGTTTTTTGSSTTPTTPTQTTTTPTTTTPTGKTATKLTIAKPAVAGRTITVAGTVGVTRASLTVTLTRKGKKSITRRVTAKRGKFKLTLRGVPRGRWTITVRYPGSSTRLASAAARTITVR